jgi:hypothetical protein
MSDRKLTPKANIPRRKLEAIRALSAKPGLISELLDDILAEHPPEPSPLSSWYGSPKLAVLHEPVDTADNGDPDLNADGGGGNSAVSTLSGPLPAHLGESSDDYPAVVAVLDSKTRVIEGSCRIQWIIQKRRGGKWYGVYFCRTKEGLLLYARPLTPELLALPERFPERSP